MISLKQLKQYPEIQKSLQPFGRVSLSQFGEDILLGEYIGRGQLSSEAKFIDLGCFHPLKWSNTAGLYLCGWRGLNIDANPKLIEVMKSIRSEDVSVCAGIADQEGTFEFFQIGVGASSTIDVNHKNLRESKGTTIHGSQKIQCYPIMSLLKKYIDPNDLEHYEYIDIDLEGLDECVVKQIDWSWLPIKLVTVEIHVSTVAEVLDSVIFQVLTACGFRLEHYVQATAFFYRERAE